MGKVKVASYDMLVRKLYIVPVNELNVNAGEIKTGVNEIFLPYGVEWDARLVQPFTDKSWDLDGDGLLDAGESGMLSKYTGEMKALNAAFASNYTIENEAIYVFVLQGSTGSTGMLLGDMPISSKFGYLFSPKGEKITSKTVAHEVAHGMFQLKHTFDEDYALEKESTDNLMDYTDGTVLFKQQWDAMYDEQALLFAWLQDEEEGQAIGYFSAVKTLKACHSEKLDELLLKDKQVFYFFSPSDPEEGKVYKIAIDDYTRFNIYVYEYSDNYHSIRPGSIAAIERDGIRSNAYFEVGSLDIDEFKFQGYRYKKDDGAYEDYAIEQVPAGGSKYGMLIPYVKVTEENKAYKLLTLDDYKGEHVKEEDISTALADCDCWDQKGTGNGTEGISQTIEETEGNSSLNADEVKSLLSGLPTQAGTSFEFVQKGRAYYLDEDGKVKEREVPLSEEDLNNGNWTDSDNLKIRLGYDENGNLQVNALGIKKDIVKKDKTANVSEISQNLKDDFNKILSENNIKGNVTPNSVGVNLGGDNSNPFPGGGDVQIDGDKTFFAILAGAGGITVDFLKTAEIQKDVYLSSSDATIKAPGIVTGTLESAAMAITDITSMVSMVSDLAFDKTARNEAKEGFKAIGQQIKDEPTLLFPMLGEIALQEFTGSGSQGFKDMLNSETDYGKRAHIISKTSVRTAVSVFASAKFVTRLPDMAVEMAAKMPKAKLWLRFRNISDDLAEGLLTKFDDLADGGNKFLDDFMDASDETLQKFLNNQELVDAWKKMDNFGADDALRQNTGALEALAKPKGSRPDPSTYLSQKYIDNHLAKFDDGAVRFTTQSKIDKYKTLGNDEAFTMPKREYDLLFEETGGDLSLIEQRLGLNPGDLTGDDAVIAWIKKQDMGQVKMPSGNEGGVIDEFWIPGGKTSGGVSEGIIDLSNLNLPYTKL